MAKKTSHAFATHKSFSGGLECVWNKTPVIFFFCPCEDASSKGTKVLQSEQEEERSGGKRWMPKVSEKERGRQREGRGKKKVWKMVKLCKAGNEGG